MDEAQSSLETPPPFVAFRARPEDRQKTIVITGAPRGGTTLGGSIVANLGVPFSGTEELEPHVGRRYSHYGLNSRVRTDPAKFIEICRDIDRQHDVWAIKNADFIHYLAPIGERLRNPHYVMVFKEPLSVAMRSRMVRGKPMDSLSVAGSTKTILKAYADALDFCVGSDTPALLISYDRAMRDMERTIKGVADFLGIPAYDATSMSQDVTADRDSYFEESTLQALSRSSDWRRRLISRILRRLR